MISNYHTDPEKYKSGLFSIVSEEIKLPVTQIEYPQTITPFKMAYTDSYNLDETIQIKQKFDTPISQKKKIKLKSHPIGSSQSITGQVTQEDINPLQPSILLEGHQQSVETSTNLNQIKPKIRLRSVIEQWLPILDYEHGYNVSNYGRIRSIAKKKIMTNSKDADGYERVKLTNKSGKRSSFYVNRLVALHFVPNPDNKPIVDHINNNHSNNIYLNLRWVTAKENAEYYHREQKVKVRNKIIYQYDLEGKLITKWNNYDELLNQNQKYNRKSLYGAIGLNKPLYGYIWKYEDKEAYIGQFLNVGELDGHNFDNYEVSNAGKVKGLIYDKILKPASCHDYPRVSLLDKKNGNYYNYYVHQLVANLFVEGRTKERNYVNHIDENQHNNNYINLEWVTHQENIRHSCALKVNQIDSSTGQILMTFDSIASAGLYMNISAPNIIAACKGKRNSAGGYIWKYHELKSEA
jgi:hypothetical protein